MAPVQSLEVNGKVSAAFNFLIVLKESISTSCIVHIHCRCISALSLDIYNCRFLCFNSAECSWWPRVQGMVVNFSV